jgi:hypothetical protein
MSLLNFENWPDTSCTGDELYRTSTMPKSSASSNSSDEHATLLQYKLYSRFGKSLVHEKVKTETII